ncbi:MAG: protein kinase [Pirellulaceae bacterium]
MTTLDAAPQVAETRTLHETYDAASTPPASTPPPPDIQGYRLLQKLGEGGMGSVFRARQLDAERDVALKLIRADRLAGDSRERSMDRLRVEARAAARLDHDHIVPVYDVGESAGFPFYSMRFVEGCSLFELLKHGPLPPREAAHRLEPVARALHAAHQQGVLHRDIKPANLLWDQRAERLLIADFGLAKLSADSQLTMEGEVFGSPMYMSPEQALGRDAETRSDVYSLGATLYHALTGRPPFRGDSVPQTLRMVVEDAPAAPRSVNAAIDRDLETICLKCLEKNPQQRYVSAEALANDLQRYLRHLPVSARPIGSLRRGLRWCRRHPVIAALTTAALGVCLAVMVYLQTRPAYLRVNVDPPDARVLLDGRPFELTDGAAVVESGPGRHDLTVSAAGHRGRNEQVMLVRGRADMAVLNIDLVPLVGRIHLDSKPPGAQVAVFSAENEIVAEGATPFISEALPSGGYTLRLTRELYKPVRLAARAPEGNQTASLGVVTLEPASEQSKRYSQLRQLRDLLSRNVETPLEFNDLPLREVVQQIADATELPFEFDEQSLAAEGVSPDWKISTTLPAGPLKDSLTRLLRSLNLGLNPVLLGDTFHFQVTTPVERDTDLVTVIHPVEELISPERPDWYNLINNVQSSVRMATWSPAGGPADINAAPELKALSIQHNWMAQLEILEFLTDLRRRHIAGGKQGLLLKSDDERAVVAAAETWLGLIDDGEFADSWEQASPFLRQHNAREKWVKARKLTPRGAERAKGRVLIDLKFLPKAPPGMGDVPAVALSYRTPDADFDLYETVVFAKFDVGWQPTSYVFTQAPAAPVPIAPRRKR